MAEPSTDSAAPLILFDLDDTLSDRAAAFRAWAEGFLVRHGVDAPDALEWMCVTDDGGYLERGRFFDLVRRQFGLRSPAGDLVEEYRHTSHEGYRLQPELIERLDALVVSGVRLGVVTNGGAGQDDKIDAIGIRPLLSACVVSEHVRSRKPDPEIFQIAVEVAGGIAGVTPWMVGDSPANDVLGGHRAGLATLWISLGRLWPSEIHPPVVTTTNINQALSALGGLARL